MSILLKREASFMLPLACVILQLVSDANRW